MTIFFAPPRLCGDVFLYLTLSGFKNTDRFASMLRAAISHLLNFSVLTLFALEFCGFVATPGFTGGD
jgi:hypothetical protein